jgi:nucleotide-binding universal stress UspA family protein
MTAALPDWNASIRSSPSSTRPVRSILLPYDGGEHSRPAALVARSLGELYGASLHVAYVGTGEFSLTKAARRFDSFSREMRGTVLEPCTGDPIQAIASLSRKLPDPLIVMSTDTGHPIDQDHFGSVTEALFRTKPARTVLVTPERGMEGWSVRRVLLAHDGTPICHAATGTAADLAERGGAEVIALHVAARGADRPKPPGSIPAPPYVDQPQHEWPAWAEEFMNRILAGGTPPSAIQFKLAVTGGQAGSEVAEVARDRHADLVVMAWHGHWDRHSCATRVVVRTSGCPVLLVYSAD